MSDKKSVSLYDRLPEIYRIKDAEQNPQYMLRAFLVLVESVFSEIHDNIESLYDDLFIETCDDWVISYIGDLMGTSHLSGVPWTLRADVADTIALRRRKGTIGAIELLTYNLTQWGVHCKELRENMIWNQHLNHQRPDKGGKPPYAAPSSADPDQSFPSKNTVIRGGTITLRDSAMLSLLNSPFDPFAHIADVKYLTTATTRYNLPNLGIFLWRLKAYRVTASRPVFEGRFLRDASIDPALYPEAAEEIVRFHISPLGRPVRLFNTHRFDPDRKPPVITAVDQVPGPIPASRLTDESEAGNPEAYVAVDVYDPDNPSMEAVDLSDVGLIFHLPASSFSEDSLSKWEFRGADLCGWEKDINPPLMDREIAIDPVSGRVVFGIKTEEEANALEEHLLATYTYGAVGPVGAHPGSRQSAPETFGGAPVREVNINLVTDPAFDISDALEDIQDSSEAVVIEISDSLIHDMDIGSIPGVIVENGVPSLMLNHSLIIRAADNHRPIIRLAEPLRFRPKNVRADMTELRYPTVRLEGLYITNDDPAEPLIGRAALDRLEIIDCTLDPGGFIQPNKIRAPIRTAMILSEPYGFGSHDEENAFDQTPEILLQRTISGPLRIDTGYQLMLFDSIIDAGSGVSCDPGKAGYAISGTGADPSVEWGPPARFNGVTVFGRTRVESISGSGAIFVHSLEVQDHQRGCIKFSYLQDINDIAPQLHACVTSGDALLRFTAEEFGCHSYGQIDLRSDVRIREEGPHQSELDVIMEGISNTGNTGYATTVRNEKTYKLGDQMGAYGFLMEAHKWRNIRIRYGEFMPVGVRPLLIPVT